MTNTGENKSIWFDADRLGKIEQIIAAYERQTGIRVSRSAVVMRAIDELFLAVCPLDTSNVAPKRQPSDIAA
jgi:hypothetical protein